MKTDDKNPLKQLLNYCFCFLIVCSLWLVISSLFLMIYVGNSEITNRASLFLFRNSRRFLIYGVVFGIFISIIYTRWGSLGMVIKKVFVKIKTITEQISKKGLFFRIFILILFMLLGFMLIYNLDNYPGMRDDEAMFLQAPYNLVKFGKYATATEFDFLVFDKNISVGPTVLLPVVLMFKLFGIGLFQARFIVSIYIIFTALVLYKLCSRLYNRPTALIALLLFLSMKEIILTGRQVMGDFPGYCFFLAGLLFWFNALDRKGNSKLPLCISGIFFGLSIITKNTMFFVIAAFFLIWLFDLKYTRVLKLKYFFIPCIPLVIMLGLWGLLQKVYDPTSFSAHLIMTHNYYFLFAPGMIFENLKLVFTRPEFLLTIPAIILSLISRHDSNNNYLLKDVFLCSIILTWLFWWICFNPGFERYLIFPAILSCVVTARFIKEVISFSYENLSAYVVAKNTVFMTIMTTFVIIGLIYPASRIVNNLKFVCNSRDYISHRSLMAEYVDMNVGSEKIIVSMGYSTAWGVAFLADRTIFKITEVTQDKLARIDYILFPPGGWARYCEGKNTGGEKGLFVKFLESKCFLEKQIGEYRLYKVLKDKV